MVTLLEVQLARHVDLRYNEPYGGWHSVKEEEVAIKMW